MQIQKNEIQVAKAARDALERISPDAPLEEEILHYLNGLPSRISQNGLIQAMAALKEKYSKIYSQFQHYLTPDQPELLNYLIDTLHEVRYYVFMQKRAIEFAGWLKQLANALKKKSPPDKEDKQTN